MCLAVFIASDTPLPQIAFDPQAPTFSLGPLSSEQEPVRRLFSKTSVYSAVAHIGCGCGFRYSPEDLEILSYSDVPEDVKKRAREDHEAGRESVRSLGEQIAQAVAKSGSAELYACWYGDFEEETDAYRSVTLADLDFAGESFDLVERQFLSVTN